MLTRVCVSFRGAARDEESRTALRITQSEIPRCARNDSLGRVITPTPEGGRGASNRSASRGPRSGHAAFRRAPAREAGTSTLLSETRIQAMIVVVGFRDPYRKILSFVELREVKE